MINGALQGAALVGEYVMPLRTAFENTLSLLKQLTPDAMKIAGERDDLPSDSWMARTRSQIVEIGGDRLIGLERYVAGQLDRDNQLGVLKEAGDAISADVSKHLRVIDDCLNVLVGLVRTLPPWPENSAQEAIQSNVTGAAVKLQPLKDKCFPLELQAQILETKAAYARLEEIVAKKFVEPMDSLQAAGEDLRRQCESSRELLAEINEAKSKLATDKIRGDALEEMNSLIRLHQGMSWVWIGLTLLSLVGMFNLVVWISGATSAHLLWLIPLPVLTPPAADATAISAAGFWLSKVVILSGGAAVVLLAARMYQTHVHNVVVNQHRRLSLKSYEKMLHLLGNTPENQKIREDLVAQATQSIFQHYSTGFLVKDRNEFIPLLSAVLDKAAKPK